MSEEAQSTIQVCYNHPERETGLRCNRCERPICTSCAVLTPTGYRCKECVRGQQKVFDTAQWIDYPLAFFIAGTISFAGSYISTFLSWFIIFVAPIFGMIIAEAVRFAVRKRRSRLLFRVAAAGVILGALPIVLFALLRVLSGASGFALFSLLWPTVYIFLTTSTAYYRLSGIQIR
jgi:hypothetical protein